MEVIHLDDTNLAYWQDNSRDNVMALGFFDGVHKGHQHVLDCAKAVADEKHVPLDVMSFFPHPKTVLSGGKTIVQYLMTLEEKAKVLKRMGVDRFYIVHFTKAFASQLPEQYVEAYLLKLKTVHAVAGFDFSYGFKGQGKISTLEADAGHQLTTSEIGKVECHGEKISSTLIREMILNGRMVKVKQLLGRNYTTCTKIRNGQVQHQRQYILPETGYYDVTLRSDFYHHECKVFVDHDNHTISFVDHTLLKHFNNKNLEITWKRKVAAVAMKEYVIS